MTKPLSLDALKSFAVFAETLNFTRAAESLHISQPALHVKVNELSETLGVALYRRLGRALELTESGIKVARFAHEMIARADTFVDELSVGDSKQQIVLAAGEGAFLYLLGDAIREFIDQEHAPLKLLTANREGVVSAIDTGRAHLGVAALESTPPGMRVTLLCKVGQVLVMPSNHALANAKRVRLEDLHGAKLVLPPPDRPHRHMVAAALQSAGIEWEVAVEASGWELMMHFVKLGMGLAIVNACCAVPRGLVSRSLKELPQISYYLIHLDGFEKRRAQRRLKKVLLETVRMV